MADTVWLNRLTPIEMVQSVVTQSVRRSLTVSSVGRREEGGEGEGEGRECLQKIFPVKSPDPHPEEDDDDNSHDEKHHEGDGDTNEGAGVETETLRNRVEIDDDFILVILSQLELNISGRHNLRERMMTYCCWPCQARGHNVTTGLPV